MLEFEKPIAALEARIAAMPGRSDEEPGLRAELDRLRNATFSGLTRWQTVQLARHPARPSPLDYVEKLFPDLCELHGDRRSGDDPAIIGGTATFAGRAVMVLAHARGRTPDEQEKRHYGMPRPEGFRKVERLVRLADRLGLPILTFIDTPGAFPGEDAEERGQAASIAACLEALAAARPPVVACVTGQGESGGALALSVSDRLLVQEFAVFAVISPEACSSILHRNVQHAAESAESLHLTARDLFEQGLVDEIVPEPPGGAHRDPGAAVELTGRAVARSLDELSRLPQAERLDARYRRLRSYGSRTLEQS